MAVKGSVRRRTNVGLLALFTFGLLCPCLVRPSTLNFWMLGSCIANTIWFRISGWIGNIGMNAVLVSGGVS